MRTLLLRLTATALLISLTYSCNKDPKPKSTLDFQKNNTRKSKLRIKKSKEEKQKKAKGYADFIKSITVPMGQNESGYSEGHFFNEFLKAKKNKQRFLSQKANLDLYTAYTDNITWEERGPANVPGRLRQIAIHPTNKNLWYIGTVGGGVWKTEDAGSTFTNLTDFKIPNLATSFVVLSAANTSTIYAGTGEPFNGTGMIGGIGIVKSTDEGQNWSILDSTTQMGDIARMFISQTNENILVVATTSGVYKTIDGGNSWTRTYANGSMQDLKAAPSDPNILYAYDDSNNSIIKSTDQGNTWNTVYTPTIGDSRIEIAISHQTPDKVYGSVYTGNGRDEVIVSSDGGTTWNLAPENADNLAQFPGLAEYMGGQGWYDNTINVHPTNDNIIYLGGVNLFKSTLSEVNGSLQKLTEPITDVYGQFFPQTGKNLKVHPDQHTIEYIHGDNGQYQLIIGNDGGIAISNMGTDPGFAEGDWITGSVTGLNNTQFYGADKKNGADQYIAGAQDNGTYVSPDNPSSTSAHNFVIGGDGFECVWNYDDSNKVLGGSQNNGLAVSNDGGVSFTRSGAIRTGGPFVTRFANAKNNADVVYAMNGSAGIYKTSDFGQNWKTNSIPYVLSSAAGDVAVSTANPAIVWAGKAGGNLRGTDLPLFVSTDEGETFTAVYPKHTGLAFISGIETHSTDPNTAYMLMSVRGHSKIMRTEDLGQTWEDITGFAGDGSPSTNGFPDVPAYSVLSIPNTDVLWAGTEIGIFQSLDNGDTWEYLDENIPAVSVWDMKIVNDEIVISTYGRGLWTASVPDLLGYEPPAYLKAPKITSGNQVWGQNTVNITYNLVSPYDETKIFVNDEEFEALGSNTDKQTGLTKQISLSAYSPEVTIKLVSTQGEETRTSAEVTIPLIDFESETEEYIANFETEFNVLEYAFENPLDGTRGFGWFGLGWSTGNFILNEDLYYANDSQYIAMTSQPIFIRGDETSKLDYIDIALVEPGDGTNLWDYVVVEASKDGENWIELTEKYDANAHQDWLEAYTLAGPNGNFTANESQYKQTIVDLNEHFKNGDLVLIRFKLVSDAAVSNWGWFLDEIKIQENIPTDGADLTPTAMTINTDPLAIGESGDFSFTISNIGNQDATATTASLYYSTSEMLDDNAVLIGSHTVNALAVGAEETYNEMFTIPSTLKTGKYYFHYKIDTENTVTELIESNNFINQMASVVPLSKNADNYIIKVEDETCENQNNGSINVTVKEALNYTYTISGDSVSEEGTFTDILSFDNLSAGTYTLCFGLESNPTYKQCFDLVVGEPSNLLATTSVDKSSRTVTVNIEGGTAPYNITLNGRTYSVNTNSVDLPLTTGSNHIAISSDIVCEGTVIDTINTEQLEVNAYPNPVINQLFITIPTTYTLKQIPVQVYTANGLLVLNNIYDIHNNTVEVNATSLGSGLYFVKIGNLETVKIIKK
ncbi:hypothetical protein UJ101_00848 [Flavobacteriaceae bacterium UJ101]|nr:hypothetical protein UJ101_00848 [Flavobacteriaceae bacterium UJ101]